MRTLMTVGGIVALVAMSAGCCSLTAKHPWDGAKVAVIGDSITDPKITWWHHWWKQLGEQTGLVPTAYAVSGQRWSHVLGHVEAMEADGFEPDAILVFMGTNDFNSNVPLGEWWHVAPEEVDRNGMMTSCQKRTFDFSPNTFRGTINRALSRLKHDYPDRQIVLLTPIHRGYFTCGKTNVQPDEAYANKVGLWLDDYVRCVREAGDIWSVPVIDLHAEGTLYPSDPSYGNCFNRADTDLLHPNTEGCRRLAMVVAARLRTIPMTFRQAVTTQEENE